MVLIVSAVVTFGVIAVLLIRKSRLRVAHAVVCALFGFYLASSSVAPTVQGLMSNLARIVGGLRLQPATGVCPGIHRPPRQ